jgi:hypothetical protein
MVFLISHYLNVSTLTSYTPLDVSILNSDHKIDSIYFIWNGDDHIPCSMDRVPFCKIEMHERN